MGKARVRLELCKRIVNEDKERKAMYYLDYFTSIGLCS